MRVLGVIDLRGGVAVHARGGVRAAYPPVERVGNLSVAGDPIRLARVYRDHFGVTELYVADLDAIGGAAPQDAPVRQLAAVAPTSVDAGIASADDARRILSLGAATVVVGLETLPSLDRLSRICAAVGGDSVAFSLDVRDGAPVHHESLRQPSVTALASDAEACGARTLILLDLQRVGSRRGSDPSFVAAVRQAAPTPVLLVGGGISDVDEVTRLGESGCHGVLVATALHDGRWDPATVAAVRRVEPHSSSRRYTAD